MKDGRMTEMNVRKTRREEGKGEVEERKSRGGRTGSWEK